MSRFWRFSTILLLGIILVGVALPVLAQQGPDDALMRAVRQFLSKQLNRSITQLDTYTYTNTTFTDSSFGCPEVGKTYVAGVAQGYKMLVTVQGIIYDVRTTTDGTRMVLCSGGDIKQTVGLSTYRTPAYTLLYPTAWGVTDRTGDVFFGLSSRPACAQPGMTVAVLDPADKTPDNLIDDYRSSTENAQFETDRLTFGKIGRSVLYVAPCTDNTPRQFRLTFFVAYGRAFRITQFAPQEAFGQWSDTFLKIVTDFAPASGSGGETGNPVIPPPSAPRAPIIHIFNGNVYSGLLVDLPGLPLTSGGSGIRGYRSAVPSPAGDWVAYVDPFQNALYITPLNPLNTALQARKLVDGLYSAMSVAWKPDGSEIAYFTQAQGTVSLMAVSLKGETRRIGAAYTLKDPCPGTASADPAEALYQAETSGGMVTWSDPGAIVYSLSCGVGAARMDATTGSTETILSDILRPRLSPDGSTLIGIRGGATPSLIRVSVKDRTPIILKSATTATKDVPDLVAWSNDSKTIYYSVLTLKDTTKLDDAADAERGKRTFGSWPIELNTYQVALRRINLETGVDEPLFSGDGRGIVAISPAPDASGTLFSMVPNSAQLVEGFKNNVSAGELRALMPATRLYWLPQGVTNPQLLAFSSAPVWGTLNSVPAPTPTAGPGRTAPPTYTFTPPPSPTPRVSLTPSPTRQLSATAAKPSGTPGILPTNTPRPSATPKP